MTIIVGVTEGDQVFMAADSAAVLDDLLVFQYGNGKLFRIGEMIVGMAGSPRIGQVLQHAINEIDLGDDVLGTLIMSFVPTLQEVLEDQRSLLLEEGMAVMASTFLLGARGKLYLLDRDFQVTELVDGYGAIGTASPIAYGSLHSTFDYAPELRVSVALEACVKHSPVVAAPFVYENI
jgi:ATP-dependent protease HslVU (ClpYQ) peptidase subunit